MNRDERLCSLLEPKPTELPPAEVAFTRYINGNPITSTLGFWECHTYYNDGDVPTWQPISVYRTWGAMGKVIDKMETLGYTMHLHTQNPYIKSDERPSAEIHYDGKFVGHRRGDTLPEAVANVTFEVLEG